jgi:PAS domain S-box-containing protein
MLQQLRHYLQPPTFPDAERTERAAVLHYLSLIVLVVGSVWLVIQVEGTYFTRSTIGLVTTFIVTLVPLLTQVVMRRGKVSTAAIFFISFLWCSITTRFLFTEGIRSSLLYNYANIVIFCGLTLGRRSVLVMFGLNLLPMAVHVGTQAAGTPLPALFNDSPESALAEYIVSVAISTSLIYYAFGRLESNLRTAQDSEARQRALLNAVPDLIFLNHRNGTFLDVKTGDASRLLMPPEGFLGRKPHDVLPPELAGLFMAAFEGALTDGGEHIVEYTLPMPSGPVPYEARVVPCTEDTVLTVARNISRRRMVEERLRVSEAQFRTLFQDSPIGIGVMDASGRFLAFNDALLQPGGYARADLEQLRSFDDLCYDAAERSMARAAFERDGVLRGANVRLRRKDGSPYDTLISLSHTTFNGQAAVQAIVEDITEYRRGEGLRDAIFRISEATTSAADLDHLYRSMHEIISGVMPAQNFYIAIYDRSDDLLSFPYFVDQNDEGSPPRKPGKGLTEYVIRTGRSLLCDPAMSDVLRSSGEAEVVGADAAVWLGVPLIVESAPIGVMAVQHYSDPRAYGERERRILEYVSSQVARAIEHKQNETRILDLNADLERRVRERTAELTAVNQELESFVYTISHDLRAPLRGVGGFAALLQREHSQNLSPEGLGYVQRIADGTRRMGALIDDLLSFAHISRKDVRRELVQPDEIVRQVIEELQPAIRAAKTEVTVGHLPEVSADPALLRQVFSNLIANAVKYSSKVPSPRVTVTAEREDGTTTFIVSDNGVGFDMKYAHKLFGVFQRLHAIDEFEGTGVGLAIVHRIVTRHDGKISVHAAEGLGATFSFTVGPGNRSNTIHSAPAT